MPTPSSPRARVRRAAVALIGWSLSCALLAAPFANAAAFQSARHGALERAASLAPAIAVHALLAGLIWAACSWGLRRCWRGPRPARGTVMIETLIALPILLMLIMGIAQLIVINAAGILTDLATFSAGRSAWLWTPEANANRRGVNHRLVREKARLAAAAVLTPVAPAGWRNSPAYEVGLRRLIGITQGAQIHATGNDFGPIAEQHAQMMFASHAGRSVDSLSKALDLESFRERSIYKLINAYRFHELAVLQRDGEVIVDLTYHQQCVVPIAARLICEADVIDGRGGYYSSIVRRYALPAQLPASVTPPRGSTW